MECPGLERLQHLQISLYSYLAVAAKDGSVAERQPAGWTKGDRGSCPAMRCHYDLDCETYQ